MSGLEQEVALAQWLAAGLRNIGQISIELPTGGGFALTHQEDATRQDLQQYQDAEDATLLARYDDAGNYRPLKTAPNLRHGWHLSVPDHAALQLALDLFYPGRLAAFLAWERKMLAPTPLRETLNRQSGMYRSAARVSDDEADTLVANFCRSDIGCLRTILWNRNDRATTASSRLPASKFDPRYDQTGCGAAVIPLLCQEACNLLVAEARKITQNREVLSSRP